MTLSPEYWWLIILAAAAFLAMAGSVALFFAYRLYTESSEDMDFIQREISILDEALEIFNSGSPHKAQIFIQSNSQFLRLSSDQHKSSGNNVIYPFAG